MWYHEGSMHRAMLVYTEYKWVPYNLHFKNSGLYVLSDTFRSDLFFDPRAQEPVRTKLIIDNNSDNKYYR